MMTHPLARITCYLLTSALLTGTLFAQESDSRPSPRSCYLIGNSLTWDTVPSRLDGDVQWHVDCGKSLPFIYAHPEEPCVKSSTLWPKALKQHQYEVLSVQPHYGSTLSEDVETISQWVEMQPTAVFVIHTGWARQSSRGQEYASTAETGPMIHSPAYSGALLEGLKQRYPQREFRQTHAIDLLDRIASDTKSGKAPLKDLSELHRDAIHMNLAGGRYLMHNAMRHALGQPFSSAGFESLDERIKAYLDRVLQDELSRRAAPAAGHATQ